MIYSRLSRFLIFEKELFGKFKTEEEYDQALYNLQIIMINFEKLIIVYSMSFFLSVMINTFFMHMSYLVLRKYAGGWHAMKSINCTLFSSFSFVIIPWVGKAHSFVFPSSLIWLIIISISYVIIRYAPADTEKNPLISINERNEMRWKAILVTTLILIMVPFVKDDTIRFNIIAGIVLECVTIHPVFYKLTKRSYRNYEEYESIE